MDRILIVDDDKAIVHMVSEFMKVYNMEVVTAYSGSTALNKLDDSISLILLDINMEGINGIDLCKIFRERTNIPIIFVTANSSQFDKVLGLGVGADDYVTKPFDPIELMARIKANLRRHNHYSNTSNEDTETIEFHDLKVLKGSHRILKKDTEINLTSTEYKLLIYFIENSGKVLTRKQILNNVWKSDLYDENTVTTNIKRLREKIEDDKSNPKFIKSLRGVGYIFEDK